MLAQSDNNLLAAVFLWAENRLLQQGQAYLTLTTRLYPTADTSIPTGYQGYSAPIKGWVYDSGVSGAHIINSVSGGGFSAPLTRASGIYFDYPNARVLVPKALGTNLTLTGTASVAEVNCYLANETEEEIITQGKYFVNPRFRSPLSASGVPPNVYCTPAMFINPLTTHNEAFAFGGLVDTKTTISLTVLAETNFQVNAIMSIFRDARYQYFPSFNTIQDPLDQWGDVKGGTGYNYQTYVQLWGAPGNLVYIEDVRASKVSDRVKLNPQQFAAIIDLDVCFIRQAPISSNLFT